MRIAKKELNPEEAAKQVEAVLFSSGRWMNVQEISRICRIKEESVISALSLLKKKYEKEDTALNLVNDKDKWKLRVRQKYSETVRKVVPQTELNKSVIETLAVIAWKAPVLQSEVIKIRTNKAYDDIKTLLDGGFITKEKSGRTYLIKLSKKFYDYFEIEGKENLDKILNDIKSKEKEKERNKEVVVIDEPQQKSLVEFKDNKDVSTESQETDEEIVVSSNQNKSNKDNNEELKEEDLDGKSGEE